MNLAVKALNEFVDVLAPPFVAGEFTAGFEVTIPGEVIVEFAEDTGLKRFGVGIEIIVEVYAIDVVAADDVEDNLGDVILNALFAGIEPEQGTVTANPF